MVGHTPWLVYSLAFCAAQQLLVEQTDAQPKPAQASESCQPAEPAPPPADFWLPAVIEQYRQVTGPAQAEENSCLF